MPDYKLELPFNPLDALQNPNLFNLFLETALAPLPAGLPSRLLSTSRRAGELNLAGHEGYSVRKGVQGT